MSATTAISTNTSAICPGAKALFPNNGDAHYLRFSMMAYWQNAEPSAEVFYATRHEFKLTLAGIASLEADALALLLQHANSNALSATFLAYTGVELSEADVTGVSWRMLAPSDAAAPAAPLPATPVTATT